jgi:hypothetical protein
LFCFTERIRKEGQREKWEAMKEMAKNSKESGN